MTRTDPLTRTLDLKQHRAVPADGSDGAKWPVDLQPTLGVHDHIPITRAATPSSCLTCIVAAGGDDIRRCPTI